MNAKHQKTLAAIYANPVRSNIVWTDIEKLFAALGARISERTGSRVAVYLGGKVAVFHRPHPKKETDKGAVCSVREFLTNAGKGPC